MIKLLPEKKGTFLRASLCDICNFSCEYCAKDMGMENHTPKCIDANLLSAEAYVRNLEKIAAHGFEIISFTGGEPLLCIDFKRLHKAQNGCSRLWRLPQTARSCRSIWKRSENMWMY